MDKEPKGSIRKRLSRAMMINAAAALFITSLVGLVSMMMIRDLTGAALTAQMEQNLLGIARSRASVADKELDAYADKVEEFAVYLHQLYAHPEDVAPGTIPERSDDNAGIYVMQRALAPGIEDGEELSEEAGLLANAERFFYPVIASHEDLISSIYMGTEKGQSFAYDIYSDKKPDEPFDLYAAGWYQQAKEAGKAAFTDVYQDIFGRGLTITCCAPFYDENGAFAGVVGMDILIEDLYNEIMSLEMDESAFATVVDNDGNVISKDSSDAQFAEDEEFDPASSQKQLADDPQLDPETTKKILNRETGVSLSNSDIYFAYVPIDTTDWEYCIRIPRDEVLEPVKTINREILAAVVVFLLVSVFMLYYISFSARGVSGRITGPLIALGKDAALISGGNLDHRAQVTGNDEIADLAEGFNDMAASLKEYIEDLTRVTAEKERIGAELNVATQIQADMLPRIFPPFPERKEFDVYATMNPAKEVGGDFYDFFLIDDDHLGLVMADVSGKGVPAALFMVIAKTLIKNRAQMGGSPAEILADVNGQLCEGNEADLFVTAWLAIIEISTGKGIAANAGHEHPAMRRAGGSFEMVRYHHSPVLAALEDIDIEEHTFEMHPGDSLFVYTDGVTEAANSAGEMFGDERLAGALNVRPEADPKELLDNVRQQLGEFVDDAPQFDDITMMGFSYYGVESDRELQ